MRQRYAEDFPILDMQLVENEMVSFARDPEAIQKGYIPQCWLDYVSTLDEKRTSLSSVDVV
jgi:hypothetical protein